MKKIGFLFLFFSSIVLSQTKGISYQALIIDPVVQELPGFNNNQVPLANKNICLKFSIIDELDALEYEEIFSVTTDNYGMVNLIIGTETSTGGYAGSFEDIIWSTLAKNLKVDLSLDEGCFNFTEISNAPFTAVPFALFALNTQDTPLVLNNEAEIILLKALLAATQAGAGLNTDGTYTPDASTNYINSVPSLKEADTALDGQVKNNADSITSNTSDIAANSAAVANNTININTNTTDIAANSTNITTNTTGIADNTTAINERVKIVDIIDDLTTGGTMQPLSAEQGKVLKDLVDNSVNITVENNLTSTSTTNALSANQGKVLKGLNDTNATAISARVETANVVDDLTTGGTTVPLSAEQGKVLKGLVDINTVKITNVTTDLSITGTTGARTIVSSDGTDAIIPIATTTESGLLSTALFGKLDGIAAGADVTDATNVTAAGALMDSEVTDLAGVKAVTISTLQVKPSEGAFNDGDKTKLDGIAAGADVTDATNVTAAGAVMTTGDQTIAGAKTFSSTIVGNINGNAATATEATNVTTSAHDNSNETVYPTFVNSAASGTKGIETDIDLTYNPNTGELTATAFSGDLNGTANEATNVTASPNNNANATVYPTFVNSAAGGTKGIETDSDLTYNPNTGELTATTFSGNLNGTINTATTATTQTAGDNSTKIATTKYVDTANNTNANLTGEVTSIGNATTLTNSAVIGQVLTGFTSGAGTISATDNILEAVQKLDGNNATNANLTGMVTSVGNETSLGSFTSDNLSGAVTDETGTGSAVFATSPTLVTPALGTPSALVGTNITGTASGLTAGNATTAINVSGTVAIANGGTGATNPSDARSSLGVYAFRFTLTGGSTTENINLTALISGGHLPSGYIFTGTEIITATLNFGTSAAITSIFPESVTIDPDLDVLRINSVGGALPNDEVSIIIIIL